MTARAAFRIFLVGLVALSCAVQVASSRLGDSPALIASDGKSYYAWIRSVVVDGDIDFRNDYEVLYPPDPLPPEHSRPTPKHDASNKYPIGMALLEAPATVVAHGFALAAPGVAADGASWPYQFAVVISLIGLAALGLRALHSALRSWGVDSALAGTLAVLVVMGTNLVHYIVREPSMPHAAGVAILSLAIARASDPLLTEAGRGRKVLELGALIGVLLLIRNSNIALVPFVATVAVARARRPARLLPAVAVIAVLVALQPISLHLLWGDARLSTYGDEGFTGAPTGLWAGLLSARHGLLVYHPLYLGLLLLCALGLTRHDARAVCAAALVSFAGMVVINGSWSCWWFGASFGNRAYIETLPALALAAGCSLRNRPISLGARRAAVAVGVACVLLNMWLWLGFLLRRIDPEGSHTVMEAYTWIGSDAGDPDDGQPR